MQNLDVSPKNASLPYRILSEHEPGVQEQVKASFAEQAAADAFGYRYGPPVEREFVDRQPIGAVTAENVVDLKFRRAVEKLHAKGPRAVGELLAEIGAERSCRTEIEAKLERFAAIDDEVLHAMDANRMPTSPIHEVKP